MPHHAAKLADIRPIELKDVALNQIDLIQITCLDKRSNGLWHAANNNILAKDVHDAAMHIIAQWQSLPKTPTDQRHGCLISKRPKELLEVHWKHFKMALFAWNDDILDVFID